jgi:hypothetical protein
MTGEDFAKAETWLDESLFAQELLKRSYMREKTLKALLYHSWSERTTFEEISKSLKIQQAGAWKCWKRGADSIMKSFFTLKLALYAGVLDMETAQIMLDDLLDYVSLARGEGNREEIGERIELRLRELIKIFEKKR